MSIKENKSSAQRCFEEVWNKGNLAVIPDVISPEYVSYGAQQTEMGRGLANFEQTVKAQRAAFPDLHYAIDSVVGQGDWLAIRLSVTGTLKGKMGNIEPTGKRGTIKLALFNRYVDGKCVESAVYYDQLNQYRQWGIPMPKS